MQKTDQEKKHNGFTLIETLLYISIAFVILSTVSIFFRLSLESRVKNQTIAEVEQQGIRVMQIITQTIRNSEGINSPAQGTSGSSLSLNVAVAEDDPAIFNLSEGILQITEGASSAVNLTNSNIEVTDLSFTNLSRDNTFGIVRVEFTLDHVNTENRNEFNFTKTFYGSATLRQ